jgi:hypothetical protein
MFRASIAHPQEALHERSELSASITSTYTKKHAKYCIFWRIKIILN